MADLVQGAIVLAEVGDQRGANQKVRPLVVITRTADIPAASQLVTVAITGTFAEPLQRDEVRLQWHPRGQCRTKLRKPSVAKCSWLPIIAKSDIQEIKGFIPLPQLQRIVEIATS